MSQRLKQLFPGFLWLIVLAALAVVLVLLLSRAASQRIAQNPESSPATEPATAEIPTETPPTVATTEPTTPTSEATTETPPPETATPAVITTTETTTPTVEVTPPATTTVEPTSPPTETPAVSSTSPIPTPSETPLLTPTDTPTLTPTLQATPTLIPGDTIPIDAAPAGEAILYTAYPQSAEGIWEGSLRFAPIDDNAIPIKSFSVTFPVDFNPMLDPISAVSPNGRYVLLLKPNFPGGEPYIFDRETNEVKPIFDDYPWGGGFGFDWSPDSKYFVFWALDVGLWMINVDTTKETLLTIPDGPVQRASISPSGQQVSFIGPPLKNDKIFAESLWVVEANGGKPSWILDVNGSRNPGWSTEGILYFKGEVGTQKGQLPDTGILWTTNVDGNQQRNFDIPIARGLGFESHLSPDRTQLAFTGYIPDEAFDCDEAEDRTACIAPFLSIYILDLTNSQIINLGKGIQPTWSPDGKSLVFISYRTGAPEVWLTKTDGSELRQLTNDGLFKQIAWWLKARG